MSKKQEFIIDHATGQKFPLIRVKPAPINEVKPKMGSLNSAAEEIIRDYSKLVKDIRATQKGVPTKQEMVKFQRRVREISRKEKVLFVRRNFGKIPLSLKLQAEMRIAVINMERSLVLAKEAQNARKVKRAQLKEMITKFIQRKRKTPPAKRKLK